MDNIMMPVGFDFRILFLIIGILALAYAGFLYLKIIKQSMGNERMKELAEAISDGAAAFLRAEYKILVIFIVVVAALLFVALKDIYMSLCFVMGAVFSTIAGYFGMKCATSANSRTANAAKENGMNKALSIAFSGGATMGMCVVGFGIIGISLIFIVGNDVNYLFPFGLGASSIALFARVGGGIYTKAADVAADLVGKVEAGIPEDDPRNPAVIADNVGDNVGDVAGMGADLFESYVGSLASAVSIGFLTLSMAGALYPLFIAGIGILAAIVATFFVKGDEKSSPHKALKTGTYISSIIVVIAAVAISEYLFKSFMPSLAIIIGLVVGILVGIFTEVYTSSDYRFVRKIANHSMTGPATTIISGISVGMNSTVLPIIFIAVGIFISHYACGLYGIALAAVGMLSTAGITIAVDAYGPIADNAGGIAEMAGLESRVRNITDKLDAVGNTTAAMGKGFAIGSAALTSLALFVTYSQAVQLQAIDILDHKVIIGMFIGGMLPFLFSALTMDSVSKAAGIMIEEVRRQFKENPDIMKGLVKPDYKSCVGISTTSALKEMLIPGVMAVAAPVVVGLFLGKNALGGMLAGSLVTGVLLGIFMSNAGGAWDNAKKYIEDGNYGGKGSEAHKAAVVGDTVGDPFKDTSGPSINILIKLMTIVSLVCAPLFM